MTKVMMVMVAAAMLAGCSTICKLPVPGIPGCPPATVACCGDCDSDGKVVASEVGKSGAIKNGTQPLSLCPAADCNGDGKVDDAEFGVVNQNALSGCPK